MIARLKLFLAPPPFADEDDNRIAGILNAILLTFLAAGISLSLLMVLFGNGLTSLALVIATLLLLGCYGLMRRGYLRAAGIFVLLLLILLVVFILYDGAGVHDLAILLLPIIIIIAGLILESRRFAVIVGLIVVAVGFVIVLEEQGLIERAVFTRDTKVLEFAILSIILVITAVTIYLLTQNLKNNLSRAQKSEAQWRSLVKNAPEMITYLQRDGTIDFLNTIMDEPDQNVIGRTVYDFTDFDYHEAVRNAIEQVLMTGESASCETIGIRVTGVRDWFDNRIGAVKQQGEIVGLTMISTNISERHEMEMALEAERDFAQRIIDNMGQGLTMTDENGRFIYANPAYTRITGYTLDDLIGKTPYEFVTVDMHEKLKEQSDVRRIGETSSYPAQIQHVDGNIVPVLITGVPRWQDGMYMGSIAVVTDLTEQTKAENERERLITELEAQNAELERFTYTVSHDLKSPLITIRGFLGVLAQDLERGDDAGVQTAVTYIDNAAETMESLLRDLLDLSRVGRVINAPEATSFATIVAEALRRLSGQIETADAQIVVAEDLPFVLVDRIRMVEVMQNLLDNAIKFSQEQPQPLIEVGTEQQEGETLFFVRDNGVGIPPPYQLKVFGLFERLDNSIEGTGIGLALVKRIIEVHNGRLWLESAGSGQGTTFYFTIPLAAAERGSGS